MSFFAFLFESIAQITSTAVATCQRSLVVFSLIALPGIVFQAGATKPLPEKPPVPDDNQITEAKIKLGKKLFFDPRISQTGTVSCNTCHNVMEGGDDGRPTSEGVKGQFGPRNAPTVWNAAFHSVQFWDGRAESLEEQAKKPITNPVEMGMSNHNVAVKRIKEVQGYVKAFKEVLDKKDFTIEHVVKAIATYERTLITPNSPFDRYKKGDKDAMTAKQIKGFKTFKKVGCTTCHSGPNFSGPDMPMGKGFYMKFPRFPNEQINNKYNIEKDLGRYKVTKKESDKHKFRVPTLRNITLTAPYFHNGQVNKLSEAVRIMGKVQLDKDLSEKQISRIVAFLKALTGKFPEQEMPRLPSAQGTTIIK